MLPAPEVLEGKITRSLRFSKGEGEIKWRSSSVPDEGRESIERAPMFLSIIISLHSIHSRNEDYSLVE